MKVSEKSKQLLSGKTAEGTTSAAAEQSPVAETKKTTYKVRTSSSDKLKTTKADVGKAKFYETETPTLMSTVGGGFKNYLAGITNIAAGAYDWINTASKAEQDTYYSLLADDEKTAKEYETYLKSKNSRSARVANAVNNVIDKSYEIDSKINPFNKVWKEEDWKNFAKEEASLLMSGGGSLDLPTDILQFALNGDVKETSASGLSGAKNILQQDVTSDILEKTKDSKFWNWEDTVLSDVTGIDNFATFLTDSAFSTAQSLAIGSIPYIGSAMLGTEAGAAAVTESIEEGCTPKQAVAYGVLVSIFEMLFEKVSLEAVIKPSEGGGFLKNLVKSMFVEATEEGATEIADMISSALIKKDKSEWAINKAEYLASNTNATEKKAEAYAFRKALGQVNAAALGGALSGGVMSGASTALNTVMTKAQLSQAMSANPQDVIDSINEIGKKAGNTYNLTEASSINEIYNAYVDAVKNVRSDAIRQQLQAKGVDSKNIDSYTDTARKAIYGYQSNFSDLKNRFNTDVKSVIDSANKNAEWKLAADATNNAIISLTAPAKASETANEYETNENTATAEIPATEPVQPLTEGQKALLRDAGKYDEIKRNEEAVKAQNAENTATSVGTKITDIGVKLGVESVDNLEEAYNNYKNKGGELDAYDYAYKYSIAEAYGSAHANAESIKNIVDVTTDEGLRKAHADAYIAAETKRAVQDKKNRTFSKKSQLATQKQLAKAKLGGTTISSIDSLSKEQRVLIKAVEQLYSNSDVNIYLFQNENVSKGRSLVEGKTFRNGAFVRDGNNIYIDVNSNILQVATHESIHYIKASSPELYDELRDVVRDYFVRTKSADYWTTHVRYMQQRQGLTFDKAEEEIIARAMGDINNDTKEVVKFAKEHNKLANVFYKFINKVYKALKAALNGYNTAGNEYSKTFLEATDSLAKARLIWARALNLETNDEAVEASTPVTEQAAANKEIMDQVEEKAGEADYSETDVEDAAKNILEVIKNGDFSGLNERQRAAIEGYAKVHKNVISDSMLVHFATASDEELDAAEKMKYKDNTYAQITEIKYNELVKNIYLGAFPAPSVGIVDKRNPTTGYGDITIIWKGGVFTRPDNFQPTFEGDGYSNTFPSSAQFITPETFTKFKSKYYIMDDALASEVYADTADLAMNGVMRYNGGDFIDLMRGRIFSSPSKAAKSLVNLNSVERVAQLHHVTAEQVAKDLVKCCTEEMAIRTEDARLHRYETVRQLARPMTADGIAEAISQTEFETKYRRFDSAEEVTSFKARDFLKSGKNEWGYYEVKPQYAVHPSNIAAVICPEEDLMDLEYVLRPYADIKIIPYSLSGDSKKAQINTVKTTLKMSEMGEQAMFSETEDTNNAPIFYSYMGKVIEQMNQKKFDASTLAKALLAKGVKAEEIKWSGIEEFLEGKKSVTKEELLDFVSKSMLKIEENILGVYPKDVKQRFEEMKSRIFEIIPSARYDFVDKMLDANTFYGMSKIIYSEMTSTGYTFRGQEPAYDVPEYNFILRNKVENGLEKPRNVKYKYVPPEIEKIYYDAVEYSKYDDVKHTRWSGHKTEGGSNYRELLFKIAGSTYSNSKMRQHWGQPGVLAHARVQDFQNDEGGKVLFIDEIQSDWHNQGHKNGYVNADFDYRTVEDANTEYVRLSNQYNNALEDFTYELPTLEPIEGERLSRVEAFALMNRAPKEVRKILQSKYGIGYKHDKLMELKAKRDEALSKYNEIKDVVPDAPFKDTYTDYVIKRLIRVAAEEGYSAIAWTTSEQQLDRWNSARNTNETLKRQGYDVTYKEGAENDIAFKKGYEKEYDKDIPKFVNKYTQKWGGKAEIKSITHDEYYNALTGEVFLESQLDEAVEWFLELNEIDYLTYTINDDYSVTVYTPDGPSEELSEFAFIKCNNGINSWVFNLTPTMIDSVLNEGQPLYSITDDLDDRQLLADAIAVHLRDGKQGQYYQQYTKTYNEAKRLAKTKETLLEKRNNTKNSAEKIALNRQIARIQQMIADREVMLDKIVTMPKMIEVVKDYKQSVIEYENLLLAQKAVSEQLLELQKDAADKKLLTEQMYGVRKVSEARQKGREAVQKAVEKGIADTDKAVERQKAADDKALLTEQMYGMRKVSETRSKYEAQLIAQQDEYNARIGKLRTKLNETWAKRLQERVDAYAAYRHKTAERRLINYYKPRLAKLVASISETISNPTAKKHLPEYFGPAVADFLSCFDFTTKDVNGDVVPNKANEARMNWRESMINLKKNLEASNIENGKNMDVSPELQGWFDLTLEEIQRQIPDVDVVPVQQLSGQAVQFLYRIVKSLNHTLNEASKNYDEMAVDVVARSESIMNYVAPYTKSLHTGLRDSRAGGQFFLYDNAQLYTVLKRLGPGGEDLFREFARGQSKFSYTVQGIEKFFDALYTAEEIKRWRSEPVIIKISGQEVKVPVSMLMSLHCLLQRDQARKHIYGQGVRFADLYMNKKGQVERQRANNLLIQYDITTFTEADAEAVEKFLQSYENGRALEVANKLQDYMSTTGSALGNYISLKRFGYNMFTEEKYFPIVGAKPNEIASIGKRGNIWDLLNKSWTKETIANANNAILVADILDVAIKHMSEMALYNAYAFPVLDTIKMLNYETEDANRNMRSVLNKAFGKNMEDYLKNFLSSVNNEKSNGIGDSFTISLTRKARRTMIPWNLRVWVQQIGSIPRALDVIEAKYITYGFNYKKTKEEMLANSGIATWKNMNYFDVDVSRTLMEKVSKEQDFIQKFNEKGMRPAEKADEIVWVTLWNAAKNKAEAEKAADVMSRTNEIFNDIVYQTQVVDSVIQKSQLMRANDGSANLLTGFMSEATTSYNRFLLHYDEFRYEQLKSGTKVAWQKNGNKIAKSLLVYALTQAANAVLTAPIDAARDKDDAEYLEKLLAALKENLIENLGPAGFLDLLPYYNMINDLWKGWSAGRDDATFIESYVNAAKAIEKAFKNQEVTYNTIYKLFQVFSYTTGLPGANMLKDAVAIYNETIGRLTGKRIK